MSGAPGKSFTDGWFRTGDIAVIEDGYYRILGRSSVDIVKSGGYKISALEIEDVLLTHEDIRQAAVVGLPDDTWGEIVAAAVTLKDGASLDLAGLKQWCAGRMSAYKIPRRLKVMRDLPRNAMGKVVKTGPARPPLTLALGLAIRSVVLLEVIEHLHADVRLQRRHFVVPHHLHEHLFPYGARQTLLQDQVDRMTGAAKAEYFQPAVIIRHAAKQSLFLFAFRVGLRLAFRARVQSQKRSSKNYRQDYPRQNARRHCR